MTVLAQPMPGVMHLAREARLRRTLARVTALAAVIVMVLAARELAGDYQFTRPFVQGAGTAIVGLLLMQLAFALSPPPSGSIREFSRADAAAETATWPIGVVRRRCMRLAVAASVVGMLTLVEANTGILGVAALKTVPHHVQFALLVAGCILPIWGLSDRPFTLPHWRSVSAVQWLEVGVVTAITVAALTLRLHDLEAVRAFVDEANFLAPLILQFPEQPNVPLLQPLGDIAAFPLIYPYFQWVATGLTDSGLVALRLPSAVFGALTIPAAYMLAKQLFDWRVAALAALLLATNPVHMQWSRLGMNNAADPLFGVLAFGLLIRGVKRGGSWHFAAAGVCFGLTHYFYEGGRLAYTLLAALWFLYFMLLAVWRDLPRRYVAVLIFTTVLIAGPIYVTLKALDRPLTARFDLVQLDPKLVRHGDIWTTMHRFSIELQNTLLRFANRPEIMYYAGDYPLFNIYAVPPLLLGLAAVLRRWRTPVGSLLLLWGFGPIIAASLLLYGGSSSSRLLVAYPVYMVLCALGIVDVSRLLWGKRLNALLATSAVVVGLIGVLDVAYYFGVHIETMTRQHYVQKPEQEVAFHARNLPSGTRIHFVSRRVVVWRGDLNLFVRSYNPSLTVADPSLEMQDDGYIQRLHFSPADIFYIDDGDTITLSVLRERFLLDGPIRWPQPYLPAGLRFVAYRPVAERGVFYCCENGRYCSLSVMCRVPIFRQAQRVSIVRGGAKMR